jgi:hypothetical protein
MTTVPDRPQPLTDVSAGGWIAPRLGPFGATAGSIVPRGYPAYARVLHPAPTEPPTTWASVCAATGATPHALMQWSAITRGDVERWGHEAGGGSLEPRTLGALCAVLEEHTAVPDWFFAVWDGWGWLHEGATVQLRAVVADDPQPVTYAEPVDAVPGLAPWAPVDTRPKLALPHRDYLLFSGRPDLVDRLGDPHGPWDQSPSLFWPSDRSWCVATEIDLDSTLVGGPTALVDAVLAAPGLEAWAIDVDGSLAFDADTINR